MMRVLLTACVHLSVGYRHQDSQNLNPDREGDRPPDPRNGDKAEAERSMKKLLRPQGLEKVWVSYLVLVTAIIVPLTLIL